MFKNNFGVTLDLHKNSFGIIRFILALAVLYHHSYPLGGFSHEPIANLLGNQEDVGSIAVLSFFIISGFLIVHSMLYTKSVWIYAWKRFLRIMPAFWVCLIVTAFAFAPLAYWNEHATLEGFLTMKDGPFSYIYSNFFLIINHYNIGKLLDGLTTPHIWDGSLWTLILEAKGYILLGLLGAIPFIKKRRSIFLGIFIILAIIFVTDYQVPKPDNFFLRFFLDPSVFTYTTYFLAGSIFYLYRKEIPSNILVLLGTIALTVIAVKFKVLHQVLLFTAPYMIFWSAEKIPFHNFTKYGDFSYGIYIYAFPIQQLISEFRFNGDLTIYLILSVSISMIFAVASWYLIEKPALGLKKAFAKTSSRST
jgi:peptidoglycan/LPS O-acetylase OafA/YrhL